MAGRVLTGTAGALVERYVAQLDTRLDGGRRDRARVTDEIRDGLESAIAAETDRGVAPANAAEAAIAELGSAEAVAAGFAGELAVRQARRILWGYLISGPAVGIWWLLLLVPRPWHPSFGVIFAAIPVLPLIAAAVATGVVVIATTGSLIRWLPETVPQRATVAAGIVAACAVIGDLSVLAILGIRSMNQAVDAPIALVVVAVTASAIRMAASARIIPRCLRTRRRLVRG